MGKRGIGCGIDVGMIAGLFQKIEEVLTGNEFKQEEGKGFRRAMQHNNIRIDQK